MTLKHSLFAKIFILCLIPMALAACGGSEVSEEPVTPETSPRVLQKAQPATGISGDVASETFFTLVVPEGATNLTFTSSGGTGDVDLYVNQGSEPTRLVNDCASETLDSNNESCTLADPEAGTYHILLRGDTAYSDVQLVGDYDADSSGGGSGGGSGGTCTYSSLDLALLEAHNVARAQARDCGGSYGSFPATGPLTLNCELTDAAIVYSIDMRDNGAWSHIGSDGSTLATRLQDAGYVYSSAGENIAKGYPDVASVMDGWLNSPGHCANIMRSGYTEMGTGILDDAGYMYWTVDFGRPR